MENPTKEAAAVPVSFYWDIHRFPVPDGYDPRRVAPSIEWNLRKLGYTGPITITAVGALNEFPLDFLESLSSSGIALKLLPYRTRDTIRLFIHCHKHAPPPANIMFLSAPPNCILPIFTTLVATLRKIGYNTTLLYSQDDEKSLWEKNLLLADPGALGALEDKCGETGKPALWACSVCVCMNIRGQCFDSFREHISTRDHNRKFSYWHTYYKPPSDEAPVIVRKTVFDLTRKSGKTCSLSRYKKRRTERLSTKSKYKKRRTEYNNMGSLIM